MSAQDNVAPIIIKKVKKGGGDGHHGGAWKVAYADFVTAMMAFFMLMWLLNATTEQQRKGIADYFAPTIAIARVSGGGDGAFGGDSVFTEESLSQNGQGATLLNPTEQDKAKGIEGDTGTQPEDAAFEAVEEALYGNSGESLVGDETLEHVMTEVTDEGLVIEVFDIGDRALFEPGTANPTDLLVAIARVIDQSVQAVINEMAIEGHVASEPLVVAQSRVWDLSSARADAMRRLLASVSGDTQRVRRVTGHADREPASPEPLSTRNNRLEIVLLRDTGN